MDMEFARYTELVYKIIGAAMRVHKHLNWGLLEPIYNEALCMELAENGISAQSEQPIQCYYKGRTMKKHYQMDVVVDNVIIELKSTKELIPKHRTQLFNYMRLTRKPIGLLINFGEASLKGERYGLDPLTNECHLLDKDMKIVPMPDNYYEDGINWDDND